MPRTRDSRPLAPHVDPELVGDFLTISKADWVDIFLHTYRQMFRNASDEECLTYALAVARTLRRQRDQERREIQPREQPERRNSQFTAWLVEHGMLRS